MNEPWTLPPRDSSTGALDAGDFQAAGLDLPRATVITYTATARLALVAKGRFLTIANAAAFTGLHAAIKALPSELASAHAPVGIVTLKNRTLTPVAHLLFECAREVAKSMAVSRRRQLQKAGI
jgi:DNA-binding transcriptional LysR family regulator